MHGTCGVLDAIVGGCGYSYVLVIGYKDGFRVFYVKLNRNVE